MRGGRCRKVLDGSRLRTVLPALIVGVVMLALTPAAHAQTVTEFGAGITPGAEPRGITAGSDGNLWFTESSGNRIGRITPSGMVTEFGGLVGSNPEGITAGPDGNLWFAEFLGNRIGRITTSGTVTEFSAGISAGAFPNDIAAGPDGRLWFTEYSGNRIGAITTTGVVTEYSAGITAGAGLFGITAGPDGRLWFTESQGDRIGAITTAGVVTEYSAGISPGSVPYDITSGPDGNLWFTEAADNQIGRITTAGVVTEFGAGITPAANLTGIVAGPDGNLWFSELNGDQIGRITTAGTVTEFSAGITNGAGPEGIAVGPDDALWFAERNVDQIGRITTGVVAPPVVPPATPPVDPPPAEPPADPPSNPPADPGVPEPIAGRTVVVEAIKGTVLVKVPGASEFVPLEEVESVPVGSRIDTRKGRVELTSSKSASKVQTAQFKFGLFKVRQSAKAGAFTILKLAPPVGCRRSGNRIATPGPRSRRRASQKGLFGRGEGRFTSRGGKGSGSARGTTWQVIDRCDGSTLIRSIEGRVVARDFVRNRRVILRTGEKLVVRPRGG